MPEKEEDKDIAEQSIEERLANLENTVATLERELAVLRANQATADTRDYALLVRLDAYIESRKQVDRQNQRDFDELKAGQARLETMITQILARLPEPPSSS